MRSLIPAALLLVSCATAGVPGKYEGTLPMGRDEAERHVIVRLAADGKATVSTLRWGSFSFSGEGGWKRADNMVVVELASPSPQHIVFQHGGDLLIPKDWDRSLWGDRGPGVLYRAN